MGASSAIVKPGGMPHHLQWVRGRIAAVKKGDRQIDNGGVQRAAGQCAYISSLGGGQV